MARPIRRFPKSIAMIGMPERPFRQSRQNTYRMSRDSKEIVASSCFRRLNALTWRPMHSRGRSREGLLRALTALVVGVLATIAALHLFVAPDPQSAPLQLGDIFAGRPAVAALEAP